MAERRQPWPRSPAAALGRFLVQSPGLDPVIVGPGSRLPVVLVRGYGIRQSRAVPEQVST